MTVCPDCGAGGAEWIGDSAYLTFLALERKAVNFKIAHCDRCGQYFEYRVWEKKEDE